MFGSDELGDIDRDVLDDLMSRIPDEELSQDPDDADRMTDLQRQRRILAEETAARMCDLEARRLRRGPTERCTPELVRATPALLHEKLQPLADRSDLATADRATRALQLLDGIEEAQVADQDGRLDRLMQIFVRVRLSTGDHDWTAAHLVCVRLRAARRDTKVRT
jgi:hypothetical protein